MRLTAGTRLGPYQILAELGSGGMGLVYRGIDTRLDRTVAIKILLPTSIDDERQRERFAREARAVAALSHPHICTLYDFGSDNGVDYLVMEYLEGETLAERLIGGLLRPEDVLRHGLAIADALAHAHRHGLVHGDLKPANVMLTTSGAKLLDFGIARRLPGSMTAESVATAELRLVGTLNYMSPEQLERHEVDTRSDIFAFGALLYEMASRRRVFDGASQAGVIAAILASEPPSILDREPIHPSSLDRVVRKCLAKDPSERWQDAHDLKTALEWIDLTASPKDHGGSPIEGRANRRERAAWILACAALVGGLIAVGYARRAFRNDPADAKAYRFVIAAPEDTTLFSGGGVMALSPDGRRLALVASPRGGKPLLWIRSLDALAARPLAGTGDATQPFWSPDSRSVAFSAGGKLKRVDVATGEIQTVCEMGGAAGTWSTHGDILFKPDGGPTNIVRVPADGGHAIPITAVDSSRGEFLHNWPFFLPDGRHFLYLVWSSQPEVAGVYVGAIGEAERKRILADHTQALYVSPGYLVFRRGGVILAQRFDLGTLALAGEASPLASGVAFNPTTSRGVFSVSNTGVLAYRTAEDTVLGWFDRDGKSEGMLGLPGRDRDPAISPDGKTVAVSRLDPRTGTSNIWLIDAERGSASRLTFDPHGDSAPTWSPDGARLAFASQRSGGGRFDLYVRSSTGSAAEEPLSRDSPLSGIPSDWSRDGHVMIFTLTASNARGDIWALPLIDDRKPFPVVETSALERLGQLSPDGQWLAYESNETGTPEVYVRRFRDLEAAKRRVSTHGGVEPKWRRDGQELFFLDADRRLMAARVRSASTFEVATPVPLFETRTVSPIGQNIGITGRNQYDVAPDGRRFLIDAPVAGSSKPITVVVNWPATSIQ